MLATSVVFPGTALTPLLAVVGGMVGIAVIVTQYRRVLSLYEYRRWLPAFLLALRLTAVFVFLLLLVNPILRLNVSPKDRQRIAVLVDTSKSMGLADSLGGETRIKTAQRILQDQDVLSRLSENAQTELIGVDSTIKPVELKNLAADGDSSDLAQAISTVRDQKDKAPLSALVLLSDGCETSAKSATENAQGVPIYTVGLGSMMEAVSKTADIDLSILKADKQAFIHSKSEVKVELRQTNLTGENATVQIRFGEKVLAEQSVVLTKDPQPVELFFAPDDAGLFEYEVRVLPHPKETITENNNRFFSVKVTKEKIKVFYYEGTPRWTYKFLTRELKKDAQIALQAILRTDVSKAYQSASEAGETVLLPSTRQGLKKYDVVILGDFRAEDFSKAQATALREYVSEDGGGLIVLAGKDSFKGGLAALELEAALPVAVTGAKEFVGNLAIQPTAEGANHPAFAGMPKFLPVDSVYESTATKAGAQVLALAQGEKNSFPFCAAQRYGSGRVFLSLSDSDWKWAMKYADNGGSELFAKFWGQAIRWAANRDAEAGPQQPALITTDKDIYRLGETVKFHVQGAGIENVKDATIAGESVPLQKNLSNLDGQYTPKKSGSYKISAGPAAGEFLVERPANEFSRIAMNEPLLRQLAAASGGQYFDAITARTLPDALKAAGVIKVETRDFVFAESWVPFVLILLALGAEWSVRKRLQLN